MTRPIKFRAWDKERKEMRQTHNIVIDSLHGTPYWRFAYDELKPMADVELMQFTGLLDKNGKEIYEGDVVQIWHFTGSNPAFHAKPTRGVKRVIEWNSNARYTGFALAGKRTNVEYEVLGNIYENPELLTH